MPQALFQELPEAFGALDATQIRRRDHKGFAFVQADEVLGKELGALQVLGRNAKRIIEGGLVMHIHGHQPIDAARFHQRRQVTRNDRILRLNAPLLARIAEVGRNHLKMPGACILDCGAEEQEAAQLVVHAQARLGIES
ncbi:hypothetical protein D9M69_533930 [compost metagenome]